MNASSRWPLSKNEQKRLIQTMTENLPMLRAKLDISQEELARIIGISRQTYCAIESYKRNMSWKTYLSLVLFFDINISTHNILHHINAFPDVLTDRTSQNVSCVKNNLNINADIVQMLSKLDDQALQSVRTVLMVEYARCSKIPGEAVVKAFNGSEFKGLLSLGDLEVEEAINRIKMRTNLNENKRNT